MLSFWIFILFSIFLMAALSQFFIRIVFKLTFLFLITVYMILLYFAYLGRKPFKDYGPHILLHILELSKYLLMFKFLFGYEKHKRAVSAIYTAIEIMHKPSKEVTATISSIKNTNNLSEEIIASNEQNEIEGKWLRLVDHISILSGQGVDNEN